MEKQPWDRRMFMLEKKIVYFENVREDHTAETFALVKERLAGSGITKLVLSSTTGTTALAAMEFFRNTDVKLVIVPHQFDFFKKENTFPKETVQKLKAAGHEVHFGTMLFHTDKLYDNHTPTVIANFLRCFCQGVKVCYEIVLMATDGGQVDTGETVIAIAGTGRGADTALVMQAASSRNLAGLKVNEILCKPLNELRAETKE
jgi:hypothetical protein